MNSVALTKKELRLNKTKKQKDGDYLEVSPLLTTRRHLYTDQDAIVSLDGTGWRASSPAFAPLPHSLNYESHAQGRRDDN